MRWHASLRRRVLALAGLIDAMVTGSAWSDEWAWSAEVLAIGVEDGILLLDGEHGVEFLVVHSDAQIRDSSSDAVVSLERIQPGDLVAYEIELRNRMPLVTRLVVVAPRAALCDAFPGALP